MLWGAERSDGVPRVQLIGSAGAAEPGSHVIASALVAAAVRELGRGVADPDGAFVVSDLLPSGDAEVLLTCVDAAGNASAVARVRNVNLVAPLGVSDAPHALAARAVLGAALLPDGAKLVDAALDRDDGVALTTTSAPSWRRLPRAHPPPRMPSMVYDPRRGRIVTVGGNNGDVVQPDAREVWELSGSAWQQAAIGDAFFDGSPPATRNGALAWDDANGGVLLFGGAPDPGVTWLWRGAEWQQVSGADPEGDGDPPARFDHAMTYDWQRQVVVLFGGQLGDLSSDSSLFGDLWEWDGVSWRERTWSGAGPLPRARHGLAYDRARAVVVLHGGMVATDWSTPDHLSPETWEWDGVAWRLAATSEFDGSAAPGRIHFYGMAYDEASERVTIAGGGVYGAGFVNHVWRFDGTLWTRVGEVPFVPRMFDAAAGTPDGVVLFGGATDTPAGPSWLLSHETWLLPPSSSTWQRIGPRDGSRHAVVDLGLCVVGREASCELRGGRAARRDREPERAIDVHLTATPPAPPLPILGAGAGGEGRAISVTTS